MERRPNESPEQPVLPEGIQMVSPTFNVGSEDDPGGRAVVLFIDPGADVSEFVAANLAGVDVTIVEYAPVTY